MQKSFSILAFCFAFHFLAVGQVEKEGVAVLENGDTLRGSFRYEKERLFGGVEFQGGKSKNDPLYLAADTLETLNLEGEHYRSLSIGKEEAGVKSRSLALRKTDGSMKLYRGRYRYKSCSCQEYASIRRGAFIRKHGEEKLYLVKKNRFLDRIKNAEETASAFLPYDDLMEAVRERDHAFSGIGEVVERYNERSKASAEP